MFQLQGKNVKYYYYQNTECCIPVERIMWETEKMKHLPHLQDIYVKRNKTWHLQNNVCACAIFSLFPASFQCNDCNSVISWFNQTCSSSFCSSSCALSVDVNYFVFSRHWYLLIFSIQENIRRSIEKIKHENPPGSFWSMLPIMHSIDSYSIRSKSSFNHRKTL